MELLPRDSRSRLRNTQHVTCPIHFYYRNKCFHPIELQTSAPATLRIDTYYTGQSGQFKNRRSFVDFYAIDSSPKSFQPMDRDYVYFTASQNRPAPNRRAGRADDFHLLSSTAIERAHGTQQRRRIGVVCYNNLFG